MYFTLFVALALATVYGEECGDKLTFQKCFMYRGFGYCDEYDEIKKKCQLTCGVCKRRVNIPSEKVSCGEPSVQTSRIIGGEEAKKGAWPWQVAMYDHGMVACGGTIISPTWILTAAHCVRKRKPEDLHIIAGDYNRDDLDGDEQIMEVKRAFHHPGFSMERKKDSSLIVNDLALIELKVPLKFNSQVKPICMPTSKDVVPVGKKCYTSGWGQDRINQYDSQATILKEAALYVVSKQQCTDLNTKNLGIKITDETICAGTAKSKHDSACHGDSGGPFVCREDDGRWVHQGIVSWGSGVCNSSQAYNVFTKTASYIDWINSYVQ